MQHEQIQIFLCLNRFYKLPYDLRVIQIAALGHLHHG